MIQHIGPLRKNKNATLDDQPTFAITEFDFNQFKKQFISILDRITRLTSTGTSNESTILDKLDDDALKKDPKAEELEETSEWMNNIDGTTGLLQYV